MASKIFEDNRGNKSNSRMIGSFVILNAILIGWMCVWFGFKHPDMMLGILGVYGGLFTTMTGLTFFFLYGNKKDELKSESNQQI